MNDLVKPDLKEKIINSLLCGENPDTASEKHGCGINEVLLIMGSNDFLELCTEILEKSVKSQALSSLKNIVNIANSPYATDATKLKANAYIVDKALEFNESGHNTGGSPATMTQDQIARRVMELNKEIVKRAKPIDIGVIDADLSDMMGD